MEALATKLLLFLSTLLGVHSVPIDTEQWIVQQNWQHKSEHISFVASSKKIPQLCKENNELFLKFPMIIHGSHEIWADGKLISDFGKSDFSDSSPFYDSPYIHCKKLAQYSEITWKAYGYSTYFSRFNEFPKTTASIKPHIIQILTMPIFSSGALVLLALFSLIVFFNKVSKTLAMNISGSCLSFTIYFIGGASDYFPIDLSMIHAHKLADLGVWMGSFFIFNGFREKKVIDQFYFNMFLGSALLACSFIIFGSNGDMIQLGTTIAFPVTLFMLSVAIKRQWAEYRQTHLNSNLFNLLSMLTFTISVIYEISVVTGLVNGIPLFPIGVLFAIFAFILSVNDEITQTYNERDNLLHNLEEKVEEKTLGLRLALSEKEKAQAELVQSAKLASLGTLSAGIAHEINNSINYVNGAISPLEKMLAKIEIEPKKRDRILKLLGVVKDGSKMTVDIVRSLRDYTGLNQAKFSDVPLKSSANSVLTILKSKLSEKYEVDNQISDNITVYGNKVGINQIFMNLISNGVDAMPEGGKLTLSAHEDDESVTFSITDNGPGMPEDVAQRVFDPFFTTKDVGEGTGLGLHIVKTEIDKHGGSIEVASSSKEGTCFTITIPKNNGDFIEKEAA